MQILEPACSRSALALIVALKQTRRRATSPLSALGSRPDLFQRNKSDEFYSLRNV